MWSYMSLLMRWPTPPHSERVARHVTAAMLLSRSARCMRSIDLAFEVAFLTMVPGGALGQGPATAPPPAYAGSEACGACHEDIANAFARNPHHAVESDPKRG